MFQPPSRENPKLPVVCYADRANPTLRLYKDESNRKQDFAGKRFAFFFSRNESGALNSFYGFLVKAKARTLHYFDIDWQASFVDGQA